MALSDTSDVAASVQLELLRKSGLERRAQLTRSICTTGASSASVSAGTSRTRMNDVVEALEPVVEALEELGVRYRVGGSVASSAFGVPRSTLDIAEGARSFDLTTAEDIILHKLERYRLGSEISERQWLDRFMREAPSPRAGGMVLSTVRPSSPSSEITKPTATARETHSMFRSDPPNPTREAARSDGGVRARPAPM